MKFCNTVKFSDSVYIEKKDYLFTFWVNINDIAF